MSAPVALVEPATAVPVRYARTRPQLGIARLVAVLAAAVAGLSYGWGIADNPTHYYYAAAVRTMSESWRNFGYGAFDPAGFITVDKAPGGLWVQALFVRVFGYHTWAMLLPGVLAGAATVLVLFAVVRRWAGDGAAVVAVIVLAAMPVTVAATRVNLPDAFLVLTLVGSAYTFWRALETGAWKWLGWTAVLIGLGCHVKMITALVILPVYGAVYLAGARVPPARRLIQLGTAGVLALAVSSIWLLVMALTPASSRPYIDGSTSNSIWQMVWNYNTVGRIGGDALDLRVLRDGQPVPNDQGGEPGPARLFGEELGGQISWLLPLAAVLLVAGLLAGSRAGWLMWGGWLAVYAAAVSLSPNMHPYYTVLLAPPIAAIVGAGLAAAATARTRWWVLPFGLLATGAWAVVLLGRTPDHLPWLRPVVAVATVGAVVTTAIHRRGLRLPALGPAAVMLTAVAVLAAPVSWVAATLSPPRDDRIAFFQSFNPVAGPDPNTRSTAIPFWGMPVDADPRLVDYLRTNHRGERFHLATTGGTAASAYVRAGMSVMTMGGYAGTMPAPTSDGLAGSVRAGELRYVLVGGFAFDSPAALARKAWIVRNCVRIDPQAYAATPRMMATSALFDCRP